MQSLMNVKTGETCTIQWLTCDPQTKSAMQSCQIEEGSTVRVINKCLGSVIIGIKEKRVAIGSEAAEGIKVSQSL
ncbi:FeoA family protein [Clostridium sp. Marseille-P2415]|uniref:FeoA family protein n=1 Tax=Clostridium sp. Marseille-P2415 TaxID=1805471 RepID=UPI00098838D6|nr:FeoA family protein [Clostridium sp. Marseille-P2415]